MINYRVRVPTQLGVSRALAIGFVTILAICPTAQASMSGYAPSLFEEAPAKLVAARALTVRAGGVHLSFNDQVIRNMRQRIASNREVEMAWRKNRDEADRLLTQTSRQMFGHDARLTERIEPLILAYRLTGEDRYGRKLQEILHNLASQPNWMLEPSLAKRVPAWNSDLTMGFTGEIFGLAYDAIRERLAPEERAKLAQAYLEKLVTPVFNDWIDGRYRIHTLDTMGHNWWAHIVFGAGIGLVAIARDAPSARDYLDRLDKAAAEWWSYKGNRIESKFETFDDDGGFMESVNYAELAVGTYLGFRVAWMEMFEEAPADIPVLTKAVEFFLHNAYPASPGSLMVNFGDSNSRKSAGRTLANMWLAGYKRPEYLWYLNKFAMAVNGDIRQVPRYLVNIPLATEPGGVGKEPALPLSAWYRGIGWATMRDSWSDNSTMLAVRSGFTWNHNHADAGSFILFHKGKPLLIDSGNSSYSRPEYDQYYRQSAAHNVVTFNGRAEPAEDTYTGSHLPGAIPNMLDAAGIRYVFADATGPTAANFARNFRHFLWVEGVILVYDDLKAREPGQFAWQLHTEGHATRRGADLTVENGNAAVDIRPLFPAPFPDAGLPTDYPENMRLIEQKGYKDRAPDVHTTYYSFVPAERGERQKFLVALIPKNDGPMPAIERIEGNSFIGARIRANGKVTDVMYNRAADGSIRHRNANVSLFEWDTDAYMVSITYRAGAEPTPETIERLFVSDGSYLRRGKTTLFDSISKGFLIADYQQIPRFWFQGQRRAEIQLELPRPANKIEVNGTLIQASVSQKAFRIH